MTIPNLPEQGDTSWYDWASGLDVEARKVAGKLDAETAIVTYASFVDPAGVDFAGPLTVNGAAVGSGGGSGLPSTVVSRAAAYTALAGDFVLADATTAGFTVTLPATPTTGQLVTVKKVDASANIVTVSAGAKTIDGDANATIVTDGAGAVFAYDGTNWQVHAVTSAQGPKGDTGAAGATGATGATGPGVPVGGTAGQILAKNTATDYDTGWIAAPSGGGAFPGVGIKTGLGWYFGPANADVAGGSFAAVLNSLYLTPLLVDVACSISELSVEPTAAIDGNARLGLYSDDGSGTLTLVPGTEGTVAVTTTGTKLVVLGAPVSLTPGLYWIGAVSQTATGNYRKLAGSSTFVPSLTGAGTAVSTLIVTAVSGALPATIAPASFTTGLNGIRAMVRVV